MQIATGEQMRQILGLDEIQFQAMLNMSVFGPVARKRGRPSKNSEAMYDVETVKKEVEEFSSGKFTPAISGAGDDDSGIDEEPHGQVIRLEGKIPPIFDHEKQIGDVSTIKKLKAKILEIAPRADVPLRIKKDMLLAFDTLSKHRDRREQRKKRIPIEKYEADCQKVFNASMEPWSGEIGLAAADAIVSAIEQQTGKSFRSDLSNIVQIVHREIARVAKEIIQPNVLKVLEKL